MQGLAIFRVPITQIPKTLYTYTITYRRWLLRYKITPFPKSYCMICMYINELIGMDTLTCRKWLDLAEKPTGQKAGESAASPL